MSSVQDNELRWGIIGQEFKPVVSYATDMRDRLRDDLLVVCVRFDAPSHYFNRQTQA
jgi:hypothetical protein